MGSGWSSRRAPAPLSGEDIREYSPRASTHTYTQTHTHTHTHRIDGLFLSLFFFGFDGLFFGSRYGLFLGSVGYFYDAQGPSQA